ncbi:MAG: peptidoglycan recognition family protein [Blastocatellia bacterium]
MAELKIYSTGEWGASPPRSSSFARQSAQGIIVHNTENANRPPLSGEAEKQAAFRIARSIQHDHMSRIENGVHWADTGQNFTVSRGGIIMEGRHGSLSAAQAGQVVRGAHANSATYNRTWFGIELEGYYVTQYAMTDQQWEALAELCAWLAFWGDFDARQVKGHRQVSSTDCPGLVMDHLDELMRRVAVRKAEIIQEHG